MAFSLTRVFLSEKLSRSVVTSSSVADAFHRSSLHRRFLFFTLEYASREANGDAELTILSTELKVHFLNSVRTGKPNCGDSGLAYKTLLLLISTMNPVGNGVGFLTPVAATFLLSVFVGKSYTFIDIWPSMNADSKAKFLIESFDAKSREGVDVIAMWK